jgi:multidrug efflux system membrane fusion protein
VEQGRHDAERATGLLAQYGDVNARVQAAAAAVASAELDVEYCRVKAPFDGYVTEPEHRRGRVRAAGPAGLRPRRQTAPGT